MRKIVCILGFPPCKYNLEAPTALPYHLLQGISSEDDVHLFYYSKPYKEKYEQVYLGDLNNYKFKKISEIENRSNNIFRNYVGK